MNNSATSATHLQSLIEQYNITDERNQPAVKRELLRHYYQLAAQERATVREAMQPFIAEIKQEMLANDPLAQQANELITRLNKSGQVLS